MSNQKIFNPRRRNFALISYVSESELKDTLNCHSDDIKHYAYIKHDKDIEDNKPVTPHWHIILHFFNPHLMSAVKSWFKQFSTQNTLVQEVKDLGALVEYLTHEDNPEKYHYSKDDIKTDDRDWLFSCDDVSSTSYDIILSILNGLTYLELAKKYGREFIINHDKYLKFVGLVESQNTLESLKNLINDGKL